MIWQREENGGNELLAGPELRGVCVCGGGGDTPQKFYSEVQSAQPLSR